MIKYSVLRVKKGSFQNIKNENNISEIVEYLLENNNIRKKYKQLYISIKSFIHSILLFLYEEYKDDLNPATFMELLRSSSIDKETLLRLDNESISTLDIIFMELEKEKGETASLKEYKRYKNDSENKFLYFQDWIKNCYILLE